MSGNANVELLARLAPVRDEDLVSETQTAEARAVLAQILSIPLDDSPPRRATGLDVRHRRRLAVPVVAMAVAATAIAVLVYEWFIARVALLVPPAPATLVILIDILLGTALNRVTAALY